MMGTIFHRQRKRIGVTRWVLLATVMVFLGAGCFRSEELPAPDPVTLEVWRSQDSRDDFVQTIEAYQAVYPHVEITVRVFQDSEYEDELLAAWARGEGPDVFSIPNWRLGKYQEFIAPMPESAVLRTTQAEQGTFGTNIVVADRQVNFPSALRVEDEFPQAVVSDIIRDGQIRALPLSIDTLALYYNRDVLARANIAVPPSNWTEFRDAVQAITVLDDQREVVQPAVALGTAENVPHYFDLISVLMMQNGAEMVSDRGSVSFGDEDPEVRDRFPAIEALDFYTAFSSPTFQTYTWDAQQPDALEVFTQGNMAFYFGYHREKDVIAQRAPELSFSETPLPQIDPANPTHYANYFVESVFVNSPNVEHAWNFLNFAASEDQARTWAENTGHIPARNVLLNEQQDNPEIDVFVQQALTAKSWYDGKDPDGALEAFSNMITAANERTEPFEDILRVAVNSIRLTYAQDE